MPKNDVTESNEATSSLLGKSNDKQLRDIISRPTNLDLAETTSKPPMRFKRVVKSLQAKRAEARLLSVPNIKYQKSADAQKSDLRYEHQQQESSSSSGGNFLRRFSKFI